MLGLPLNEAFSGSSGEIRLLLALLSGDLSPADLAALMAREAGSGAGSSAGAGAGDRLASGESRQPLALGAGAPLLLDRIDAPSADRSTSTFRFVTSMPLAERFSRQRVGSDRPRSKALQGSASSEWISLGSGNDAINAGAGFDWVRGGGGDDSIAGGGGRDTLEGGDGADRFVFNDYLSAATNIDTITDFSPAEDLIVLDRSIFSTLNPGTRLNSASFRAGPGELKAATASERILYDTSTGTLAYDADGSGVIDAPVAFAVLANRPTLTSASFQLEGAPPVAPRTDPRPTFSIGSRLAITVVPAPGTAPSVIGNWVSAAADAVSSGSVKLDRRIGPTIGARFYAMFGTAVYEAWQVFDQQARTTLGSAQGPRWDRDLEQQISTFLRSNENKGGRASAAITGNGSNQALSPLATRLIESVVARTAHAVLSSPLSGIQAGSAGLTRLDQQLQATLSTITPAEAALFNGIDQMISQTVAARVLDHFRNDGSSLTMAELTNPITLNAPAYVPLNSSPADVKVIDHWTPEYSLNSNAATPPQVYLTPNWGDVQYYLLPSGSMAELTAGAPAPEPFLLDPNDTYDLKLGLIYDNGQGPGVAIGPDQIGRTINPRFIDQANEVVAYSRQLAGPEGNLYKGIAQFWENGANTPYPPGTWMQFGLFSSLLHNNSLADDTRLFLGLGASVYTASIAAWDLKLQTDYARPIRVIRELSRLGLMQDNDSDPSNGSQFTAYVRGQGLREINGVDWESYQSPGGYSPPFPEFVSGHSTFSAAAADFLTNFYDSPEFGGKVEFNLSFSYDQPDQTVSLAWDTWKGAAQEAGFSRLYGGIHFLDGNIEGQALGSAIGSLLYNQLSDVWS